jgi:hypothetical protein
MSVHIRGASGEFASQINGKFGPLKELDENGRAILCDDKPVYVKEDGSDVRIEYNKTAGSWQVKPGHARGKCVAWASISSAGSIESCNSGVWLVWSSQFKCFSQNPDIVILPASPAVELIYCSAQEESQNGKKKRKDDAEYVPDLNGVFDATEELNDRRPVYRKRRGAPTKDLCEADWIEFCGSKGQWQLKRCSHRGTGLGFACVSFSGPLELCYETEWRVWTGSKYQQQKIIVRSLDGEQQHGVVPAASASAPESSMLSSLRGFLPSSVLSFWGIGQDVHADDDADAVEAQAPAPADGTASSFGVESLFMCSRR